MSHAQDTQPDDNDETDAPPDAGGDDLGSRVDDLEAHLRDLRKTANRARDRVALEVERREALEDRVDELEARVDEQAGVINSLEAELESFVGPVGQRTGRDKRLADIRAMMISAARANDLGGCRWHWYDIAEHLGSRDEYTESDIPAKPQLYQDIATIAEDEGFTETTKPRQGDDGVHRDVKALQLSLDDLPGGYAAHRGSNQVTTDDDGEVDASGVEPAADSSAIKDET